MGMMILNGVPGRRLGRGKGIEVKKEKVCTTIKWKIIEFKEKCFVIISIGTPKKGSNALSDMDSVNVDVEGDEDCDIMLRDIMQDNSNQSSPAESVASSNASKKRDKSGKNKKNRRVRTSPNINLEYKSL